MAITKFTNDKSNNKYEDVIPNTEEEMDSMQLFMKKLADKVDEGLDETNKSTIGSNTTISFGDLTLTNKGAYQLTITATRDFGGKTGSQTKSITLTLQ